MWFAQKSDSLFHSFLKSSRRKSLSLLFNKEQQWDNGSLHSLKKAQLFHYSSQKTSNSLENQRVNSHPWNFVWKKVDCQPYSYLMSPVSHLMTHVSCLTYPVSCLLSHLSSMQGWEFAHLLITCSLKSLRTNERMSKSLRFLSKLLIILFCSQKMSDSLKNKSYLLYIFTGFY